MLRAAESIEHDEGDVFNVSSTHEPMRLIAPAPFVPAGGRYGAERRVNKSAITIAVAIHVILIAALVLIRPAFTDYKEKRLQMVEMKLDASPPPPEKKEPPKQASAEVVKLAVMSQTPPPVQIALSVPTVPTPPTVDIQPPAPPASPVPPAPSVPSMVKAGDIGTQMISAKPPRYPIEARRKHEQGTVVLSVTLGVDGRVALVSIARSSGFASLDDAARSAVRAWRWAPTIRNGQPVMVQGVVEIPFVLQG